MLYILWIFVQIILESFPVSSSGHVALLLSVLKKIGYHIVDKNIQESVNFLLHGPTIIILCLFFFARWWQICFQKNISLQSLIDLDFWKHGVRSLLYIGFADVITCLFWLFEPLPQIGMTGGFLVTSVVLYSLRFIPAQQKEFRWNYGYVVTVGLIQGVSLLPGISRFATTYAVGVCFGYDRLRSFALSFLIQFPLIVAAFLKGVITISNCPELYNVIDSWFLLSMILATVISYFSLHLVQKIITKGYMWVFAWYMLIPVLLSVCL